MSRLYDLAPAFLSAIGAIVVMIGALWTAWQQSNFESELKQKNEEIARLQREIAGSVTGGDSFCWMAVQPVGVNGDLVNAHSMPDGLILIPNFIHKGKFPLYDVSARIVDLDELKKDIMHSSITISVGNMTPGFVTTPHTHVSHHGKELNFKILYVARNGSWTQTLRMHWVGDGWASANRVVEGLGGRELLLEVSVSYPRGPNGEVDW